MSFAILRTAKLKSFGEIGGSLSHNYRTRFTPNANLKMQHKNEHQISNSYDAMQTIKNRLPEKLRKNGVLCIEHLITASPEWSGWGTDQEKEFFKKSVDWLNQRYGSENITTVSIHRDETTPHLIAYVVPLDDSGRLNARKWLGGRKLMSQMQTDFAAQVKHLGLERGLEGSKAEHKAVKEFYAEIQKLIPETGLKPIALQKFDGVVPEKKFFEPADVYAQKVMDAVFEDAQKQVAEIERSYLDSIEQLNNEYQKVLRLEQIKAKSENDARRRAEDAARKLTDQVHQLKAENEELKEQHAEEIQEIQKKYELFDEFNRLCSDESTLLDRHMRSKIYNHPSNVSEREYQRDLQLERERKQQLQLEKERERQLQLEREREQQLRLEREREQQLQLERERERQLQLERKRQEEQLERAVQNLKIEQQPTRTQTPTRTQNRDDDFDLGM